MLTEIRLGLLNPDAVSSVEVQLQPAESTESKNTNRNRLSKDNPSGGNNQVSGMVIVF